MKSTELASKYRGTAATDYERQRIAEPAWPREQAIVSSMLEVLPRNATLIDVPVGTGRFFEFYQARGLQAVGIDVSADMLAEARSQAEQMGLPVTLEEGDIRRLRFPTGAFDAAVCIRLLNLIDLADAVRAMHELARVSRRYVILGVRYSVPVRELIGRPGRSRVIMRQLANRLRAWMSSRVLRVHPRVSILGALSRSGLTVIRSAPVEQFPDGSELVIYLLEKAAV
jgi:ubiquinone/menaquinone biosynthesis C-methylase UbiE